jgi:hypothetical protein
MKPKFGLLGNRAGRIVQIDVIRYVDPDASGTEQVVDHQIPKLSVGRLREGGAVESMTDGNEDL